MVPLTAHQLLVLISFGALSRLSVAMPLDDFLLHEISTGRTVRVPNVMKRMYKEWSSEKVYKKTSLQSLYLEATEMPDKSFLMKTPLPSFLNTTISKVELWLEFQDIKNVPKVLRTKYYVDVKPANETKSCIVRDKVRPQFRDHQVEMNFNIKALFMKCKNANANYLEFQLRLLSYSTGDLDENLRGGKMKAFILLHESRPEDLNDIFRPSRTVPPLKELESSVLNRSKRNAQVRAARLRRKQNSYCGLRKWYVTFDDMGWDWVVAPSFGFIANICSGRCSFPLAAHMNATNHAIIQTLRNTLYGKPREACCTPKDMAPLPVIFIDGEDTVTLKEFPDMIVKSCACL